MKSQDRRQDQPSYTPMDDPSQVFTTYDLGCSAAILCSGYELLSIDQANSRKSLFIFRRDEGIETVGNQYWSDQLEVKARTYFDTVKGLKNRLYSSSTYATH